MTYLKIFLVVLFASGGLIVVIAWAAREFGIYSVAFTLVVAWAPNGWMLAVFAVRQLSLSEGDYQVRSWEPRLYAILGVRSDTIEHDSCVSCSDED